MTERDPNRPCMGCPDKNPGCQDWCQKPEYLAWKDRRAMIRKNRADYYQVGNYVTEIIRKNRRGK
jgi:hypothetical protein